MRVVAVLLAVAAATAQGDAAARTEACELPRAGPAYTARVLRALRSGEDVWGKQLLAARDGPTYEAATRYLAPLWYARARGKTPLTRSGAYYLPFGNLHVADGSEIVLRRIGGPSLTIMVDGERFGGCASELTPPRLFGGWAPVLQTRYRGYTQESFTWRGTAYVHVTPAADLNGVRAEYVAWRGGRPRRIDDFTYLEARVRVTDEAAFRLGSPAHFSVQVPETRVVNALLASLSQTLALGYRYSYGNPYEQFSFPESVDVAQVLAEYGYGAAARSILRTSLTRNPEPYANWKRGEKLLGWARYAELTGDRAELARIMPTLRGYIAQLERSLTPRGLLKRERYSSDIPNQVYGLHAQAVVWQGLNAIGDPRARRLAARLGRGLRRAIGSSQRRLADGSLFVPMQLLDDERPYNSLTETRLGSYWNLVAPYALASGILSDAQARGAWRYMQLHGSRLLGLVRAGAYALYRDPKYPVGGTDQVYGINVARFLAEIGEPDQLVLSLYGTLAAAMTENTFVGGEAATVAPLDGLRKRAMYLPPNSATNAAFLTTLREMLVHETRDGLELAFATPRPWLRRGKRLAVSGLPTRYGRISYSIDTTGDAVRVTADLPERKPASVRLRLRFPRATRTIDLSRRSGHVEITLGYPGRSS